MKTKSRLEMLKSDPEKIDFSGLSDLSRIPTRKRLLLGKEIQEGDYVQQLLVKDKRQNKLITQALNFQVVPK